MKDLKNHWIVSFLDNLPDGFFTLDQDWHYTYLNKTVEAYEEVKKEDVLGKVIWEVFPQAKDSVLHQKYAEAMATGKQIDFEESVDNKWFEIRVFPITNGLAIFYRDITDRKLADERKDEFIRMASHELKTPITSLRLYAELLQDELIDTPNVEYADRIIDQADRLTKLIDEMLDLSRMQLGKLEFRKRPFDLVALVEEIVHPLQSRAGSHQIITDYQTEKALVNGDRHRIMEALTNLVDNAIKYSPGKDRVILTITADSESVRVDVQDFGIGVDSAYADRLFERFYQAHGTRGKTFPGLGIGLYISKTIVDKHQGKLTVESVLGKGSTFSLTLPLYQPKK